AAIEERLHRCVVRIARRQRWLGRSERRRRIPALRRGLVVECEEAIDIGRVARELEVARAVAVLRIRAAWFVDAACCDEEEDKIFPHALLKRSRSSRIFGETSRVDARMSDRHLEALPRQPLVLAAIEAIEPGRAMANALLDLVGL